MNFLKLLGLTSPDPKPGEIWGYLRIGKHPWDETRTTKVYVKDVKAEWVCFTRYESNSKTAIDNDEDEFIAVEKFLSIYTVRITS